MADFCTECGAKLVGGEKFCSNCGNDLRALQTGDAREESTAQVPEPDSFPEPEPQPDSSDSGPPLTGGNQSAYHAVIASTLLWVVSLTVAYELHAPAAAGPMSGAAAGLYTLALLAWVASLIALYIDLDSLSGNLWRSSSAAWIIGAILGYIIAIPLYIFKRRADLVHDV